MSRAGAIRAGRAYIELFADQSPLIQGLKAAEGRLKAFGDKVASIGRSMMSLGAVAAAPIALSAKVFAGFEDQMLTVRGVTAATEGDFKRLTDQAKLLGRTTSYTAKQVAEGMTSLGRAGFKANEIEAAIPAVLNLARATGTDLGEAADFAANSVRAFGLSADDTTRVADVLTATANGSAQTLKDLAESLSYVAPIAADAGESIESTSKALGVLANMGIKGSMAGTTMRQILLSLADPAVRKRLDEIGVAAVDVAGNLRPLGEIMLDLGKAMAKLPNAQRLSLAKELFDQRAVSGALKLSGSVKMLEDLARAIDKAGGSAERTAKMMDSGLGGSFRIMMSAAEGVAIAVGEAIAKKLMDWMSAVQGVADAIEGWVSRNHELIATVGAIAAALIATGAAAWAFGKIVLGIKAGLAVFAALAKAILMAKAAYMTFTAQMLAAKALGHTHGLAAAMNTVVGVIKSAVSAVGGMGVAIGGILAPMAVLVTGWTVIANLAAKARADMEYIRQRSMDWADSEREASRARKDLAGASSVEEQIDALGRLTAAYQRQRDILRQEAAKFKDVWTGEFTGEGMGVQRAKEAEVRAGQMDRMLEDAKASLAELQRKQKSGQAAAAPAGQARMEEMGNAASALAEKLNTEAKAFGLTARQAEIFRLKLAGASDEQLAAARAADAELTALERNQKAREDAERADERYADRQRELTRQFIETFGTDDQRRQARIASYMADEGWDQTRSQSLVDQEDQIKAAQAARDKALSAQARDAERLQSIEELRLRTQFKGADLERKLLDLQEQRALEAARAAGERLDLVEQEFALRRASSSAVEAAGYTLRTETAGTFNVAAIQGLLTGGVQDRIAAATAETAKNTRRLVETAGQGLTFS